jgi:hypothetical protein
VFGSVVRLGRHRETSLVSLESRGRSQKWGIVDGRDPRARRSPEGRGGRVPQARPGRARRSGRPRARRRRRARARTSISRSQVRPERRGPGVRVDGRSCRAGQRSAVREGTGARSRPGSSSRARTRCSPRADYRRGRCAQRRCALRVTRWGKPFLSSKPGFSAGRITGSLSLARTRACEARARGRERAREGPACESVSGRVGVAGAHFALVSAGSAHTASSRAREARSMRA